MISSSTTSTTSTTSHLPTHTHQHHGSNELASEIVQRLIRDFEFKRTDNWLKEGRCPECGQKELFTSAIDPHIVRCNRANKCGWESHVRDLYQDLFENYGKRFQATKQNPTATADAYLRYQRGFDPGQIRGWYLQERFFSARKDVGTATVRFHINGEPLPYWERFIDNADKIGRKAHFGGSYSGMWWQPPDRRIDRGDEVWLVEGIFDAIALWLSGIKAAAQLSCVSFPDKSLEPYLNQSITWVIALDGDKAGRSYTLKHARRLREMGETVKAAQIPQSGRQKVDWNDLYIQGRLTEKDIQQYRYHGDLLLARSADEKGQLIYEHNQKKSFPFDFRNRIYWWDVDTDKHQKEIENIDEELDPDQAQQQALKKAAKVREIANCYPQALYYLANEVTDESWYYFKVSFPHKARAIKNTFTGGQLASGTEFKKRLVSIAAGALFTGKSEQLDELLKKQLFGIKTVQTVDFIGYSKEYGCYLFQDLAIKAGRVYESNVEDFFELPKLSIKTLSSLSLNLDASGKDYRRDWPQLVYQCWGARGIVTASFWLGSLFAEQIRDHFKSLPFLEIVGEPQSGKSTLIEFMWRLFGRQDYEGFDPVKSTLAARTRNFAQVSNLPVVLMEGDRDEDTIKSKRFDWDDLKPLYNGRSMRSRGVQNHGNDTYEPPFRGALVITQNAEVNASEAVLQRIVQIRMTREGQSPETKRDAEVLERMPIEILSHFLIMAAKEEKTVLETVIDRTPYYEDELLKLEGVTNFRIAKNHAQLAALVEAFAKLVDLPKGAVKEAGAEIKKMAKERQEAISADHPLIQQFWETVQYLGIERLNHSVNDNHIAINLNHYQSLAAGAHLQIPPILDLKRHLKSSKENKFLEANASVKSKIFGKDNVDGKWEGKSVRCWRFEKKNGKN